ncbi:hypothetical protein HD554DRAFT_2177716 [Boletus coccyginus]|nr:hypothetical protein HD554DRAFT_2177716 [Boletus coccyginus]
MNPSSGNPSNSNTQIPKYKAFLAQRPRLPKTLERERSKPPIPEKSNPSAIAKYKQFLAGNPNLPKNLGVPLHVPRNNIIRQAGELNYLEPHVRLDYDAIPVLKAPVSPPLEMRESSPSEAPLGSPRLDASESPPSEELEAPLGSQGLEAPEASRMESAGSTGSTPESRESEAPEASSRPPMLEASPLSGFAEMPVSKVLHLEFRPEAPQGSPRLEAPEASRMEHAGSTGSIPESRVSQEPKAPGRSPMSGIPEISVSEAPSLEFIAHAFRVFNIVDRFEELEKAFMCLTLRDGSKPPKPDEEDEEDEDENEDEDEEEERRKLRKPKLKLKPSFLSFLTSLQCFPAISDSIELPCYSDYDEGNTNFQLPDPEELSRAASIPAAESISAYLALKRQHISPISFLSTTTSEPLLESSGCPPGKSPYFPQPSLVPKRQRPTFVSLLSENQEISSVIASPTSSVQLKRKNITAVSLLSNNLDIQPYSILRNLSTDLSADHQGHSLPTPIVLKRQNVTSISFISDDLDPVLSHGVGMQNEVMDEISNFSGEPTSHHSEVPMIHPKESDDESLDSDEYQPSEYEPSPLQKVATDHSQHEYQDPSSADGQPEENNNAFGSADPCQQKTLSDRNQATVHHRAQYKRMISNPTIWAAAVQEIDSLEPQNYVSGSIMNLFLLTESYKAINAACCYFVDLFMTASFLPPEPEEIAQFRSYSCLFSDMHSLPPRKPVVFIVCRHQHYFTVCFDYQLNHAWVFGRNPHSSMGSLHTHAEWDEWNGLFYWKRVAALFGWPVSEVNPGVNAYDFKQVFFPLHLDRSGIHSTTSVAERVGLWTHGSLDHTISSAQRP